MFFVHGLAYNYLLYTISVGFGIAYSLLYGNAKAR